MYQQMSDRGLSARTLRYTHVVLKSAMQQAVLWRLLLENPADGEGYLFGYSMGLMGFTSIRSEYAFHE